MSLAIVFPGQGSQAVGMLTNINTGQQPIVYSVFNEASDKLGFDLWHLVQNGPKEELDKTENTQPALLACGIAIWRIWLDSGGTIPRILAGHSLGEYTALVAANVIDFGDAISLVRDRGRYMQQAIPAGQGAMAAILGLPDEEVISICNQGQGTETVSVANFNSPGQVVIAGNAPAVQRTLAAARSAGAKKVIMLDVSVPSHCALMKGVEDKLAARFSEIAFSNAAIPVIQNVDAEQRSDAAGIRDALLRQIHQPVRWTDTILNLKAAGIRMIIECGPGKVLSGLIKRIDRELQAYAVTDPESLAGALSAVVK